MSAAFADLVALRLEEASRLHAACLAAAAPAAEAAEAMLAALGRGGKVLACGNGGSAADAQHFAAELVGRFERDRPAIAALALTTDTSILTAIGNDFAFEDVFARQVDALGAPGDVLLGISTSGGSRNVRAAFASAKSRGLVTVALTGRDGGAVGAAADIHVNVPSASTARVQEVHRTLLHAICELVERGRHA
ncbi:MAG TPA: SIS domain-containing protein [Vicinamibacterales bacterium]|nr:SIS domain-containing protein [Vicinamibacterales bacterium]HPW21634.1 SIS domain-containing protein [Vicinamibacterales bacterium]